MSLVELLPAVRDLSRHDKLRLIQLIAEELNQVEDRDPILPDCSYPVWSQFDSYDAAATLLRMLGEEEGQP